MHLEILNQIAHLPPPASPSRGEGYRERGCPTPRPRGVIGNRDTDGWGEGKRRRYLVERFTHFLCCSACAVGASSPRPSPPLGRKRAGPSPVTRTRESLRYIRRPLLLRWLST